MQHFISGYEEQAPATVHTLHRSKEKKIFTSFFFLANFKFSRFGFFFYELFNEDWQVFHVNVSQFLFNSLRKKTASKQSETLRASIQSFN